MIFDIAAKSANFSPGVWKLGPLTSQHILQMSKC